VELLNASDIPNSEVVTIAEKLNNYYKVGTPESGLSLYILAQWFMGLHSAQIGAICRSKDAEKLYAIGFECLRKYYHPGILENICIIVETGKISHLMLTEMRPFIVPPSPTKYSSEWISAYFEQVSRFVRGCEAANERNQLINVEED
jgi:hypothetical protein